MVVSSVQSVLLVDCCTIREVIPTLSLAVIFRGICVAKRPGLGFRAVITGAVVSAVVVMAISSEGVPRLSLRS